MAVEYFIWAAAALHTIDRASKSLNFIFIAFHLMEIRFSGILFSSANINGSGSYWIYLGKGIYLIATSHFSFFLSCRRARNFPGSCIMTYPYVFLFCE